MEVQRACRARVKARLDASADAEELREKLRRALIKLELREEDVARPKMLNERLEIELAMESRHHTNAIKTIILLKQKLNE